MQSVFEATGIGTGGVGEGGARLLRQGSRESRPRIAAGTLCSKRSALLAALVRGSALSGRWPVEVPDRQGATRPS